MKKQIEAHWKHVTNLFGEQYPELTFLTAYEESMPFLKDFQAYLRDLADKQPGDIDAICWLATTALETRLADEECGALLEKFIADHAEALDDAGKARVYTNLGYYYFDSPLGVTYLEHAVAAGSEYAATYLGLGLALFTNTLHGKADVARSVWAFQRAAEFESDFRNLFSYGAALYEAGDVMKARQVFQDLEADNPGHPRVILALAYCACALGEESETRGYLDQLLALDKDTLDQADVDAFQIFDAYFVLADFCRFLLEAYKVLDDYYYANWEHLFYALWQSQRFADFEREVTKCRQNLVETLRDAQTDDDYLDADERAAYIARCEADLTQFDEMVELVKQTDCPPQVKLPLYPEYGCFLVDCLRHNSPFNEN